MIPFLFWIRNSLQETAPFLARKQHPMMSEVLRSVRSNWKVILLGTLLTALTTSAFYMITAYTPTFGSATLHLARRSTMVVTLFVGIMNFLLLPVMGSLSDRIGRRPLLLTCTLLAAATAYPALAWLVHTPSFERLLFVELWLAAIYASYNGAMVVYLTEIMPPDVSTTSFSLAYSLATAIFGGFTPAISTYLIHTTGNKAVPGVWLGATALLAFAAVVITARTPGLKLAPTTLPHTDQPHAVAKS